MIGRIHLKRVLKRTAGCFSVIAQPFASLNGAAKACILVYHRVAEIGFVDRQVDDWNVAPTTFEHQIKTLADVADIVPLSDLPSKLAAGNASKRPLVCLTFDDGFENFFLAAVPILARYHAPATLFVPTAFIETTDPMPFDRWAMQNCHRTNTETWRSISWHQLEQCLASGVVSIGSHSHRHLNGSVCDRQQFLEEAQHSRKILVDRFGEDQIRCYAYPYGSTRLGQTSADYIDAVRQAGYQLAVTTDLGLVGIDSDPFALPRVEAHPLDGPAVIRAKNQGLAGTLLRYRQASTKPSHIGLRHELNAVIRTQKIATIAMNSPVDIHSISLGTAE